MFSESLMKHFKGVSSGFTKFHTKLGACCLILPSIGLPFRLFSLRQLTTITVWEFCNTPSMCLKLQLQCISGERFVYPKTSACQCTIGFCSHQILYSLYLNDVAAQEFGMNVVLSMDDISLFPSDVNVNRVMLKVQ
jgi:hypothetical protein